MDKSQIFAVLVWLSNNLSFILRYIIVTEICFDRLYTKLYKFSIMGSLYTYICSSANFVSEVVYLIWKKIRFGRINRSMFTEINFCLVAIPVINSKCIFIIFLYHESSQKEFWKILTCLTFNFSVVFRFLTVTYLVDIVCLNGRIPALPPFSGYGSHR